MNLLCIVDVFNIAPPLCILDLRKFLSEQTILRMFQEVWRSNHQYYQKVVPT